MIYTVGEMAQKLGVPASTLRYYDKEGLLPFVERSSGGIRMFRENDFEWLQVIRCMKKAGMSIKDIRQYIELSMQGDDTIDTRLEMFRHQREVLTQQIQQLQHTLETVEYKCWFYEAAKAAGTVDVPGAMTDADVPDQFRAIRQELRDRRCRISKDKKCRSSCFWNGISLNLLTHGSQPYFSNILPARRLESGLHTPAGRCR